MKNQDRLSELGGDEEFLDPDMNIKDVEFYPDKTSIKLYPSIKVEGEDDYPYGEVDNDDIDENGDFNSSDIKFYK